MNPNDNQARLQVLNSTNPSLRAAVAPTPQPTIMVGGTNPNTTISVPHPTSTPAINLPGGGSVAQNNNLPDLTMQPQDQSPDVLGTVGDLVKGALLYVPNAFKSVTIDPIQAEIARARGDAAGYNEAMRNEMNDNMFAPVAAAGKQLASTIYADSGQLDQAANKARQDAINAWRPVVNNSPTAQAFVDEAGSAAASDIYNSYLGQEGIDQKTPGWQVGLKAIGTQGGIAAPLAFADPASLFQPFKSVYDRAVGNTARAGAAKVLSGVQDAGAIQSALGVSKEAADFLAQETDPNIIQNILKDLGIRPNPKEMVRTLNDVMNTAAHEPALDQTNNQNQDQIQPLDPMNPTQSQLPNGWHPDNAPDPVPVLEAAARNASTPQDFTNYVNSLTGENRAAAQSALNGMSPEDFYKAAGGGVDTSVPSYMRGTPTTVGEAAAQSRLGVNNINPDTFSADARIANEPFIPQDRNVDVPSYIKKDPQAAIKEAEANIQRIDRSIEQLGSGQSNKFNARQQFPGENRTNPDAAKSLYEHRMNAYDPEAMETQWKSLLVERQKYTQMLNMAKRAQTGAAPTAAEAAVASDIETPAFMRKQAGQQLAPELPSEYQAAIDAANGKITPEEAQAKIAAAKQQPTKAAQVASAAAKPEPTVNPGEPVTDQLESQPTPSDPATQQAINEVLKKLPTASRQYNEAAAARAGERASRAAQGSAAFESAGGGQAGLYAKMGAHAGEYSKSGFGMDLSPESRDALINSVENNPNLKPYEKLNAQMAIMKLSHDTPTGPTPYDISLLRKAFGDQFGDQVDQAVKDSTSMTQKVLDTAGQIAGLPKSVMASGDISATLRQGGVLASRHPILAAKAAVNQFRYMFSPEAYQESMAEIASRPTYQSMLDSKLAVTGTEALDKTEEKFVSNLAEKVPLLGHVVRGSDRAFTGFLTELRANVFDHIVSTQEALGNTLSNKDLDDISRVINTASGRGDLGQFLEQHSRSLSTALFSPRLWKSRLDLLNPVYYARLSPVARQEALSAAATFATEAGGVLFLMSHIPGVSVDTNPTSADFLKIRYKNERYDILGGLQQNIVLAAREAMNETTNSQTGTTTQLGSTFGGSTRLSVLTDMIQNKENPLLAAASQLLQGKDRGGNPVNPISTIGQLFVPLPISGAVQTAADFGDPTNPLDLLKGALINSPDLIGLSAQNYGNIPSKYQGAPNAQGMPSYDGPVQPNMVTDYNGQVVLDKNGKPVTVQLPNGATPDEAQELIAKKRPTAVKEAYIRSLPQDVQTQVGLKDSELQQLVKDGTITQQRYDYIKNVQKTADSVSKGNNYGAPNGAISSVSKNFFQHWNSMDTKDQQAWLNQAPDANSKQITDMVNSQRAKGLDAFQPSNKLAQLYSEYENDINNHNGPNPGVKTTPYTALDLRQKAEAFQKKAAQLSLTPIQQDIYQSGGSEDVKTLLGNGKLNKADLDAAIHLDNQLYASGLETSLKFNKAFRNAYGYGVPAGGGSGSGSGSGSSGSSNQRLTSLLAKSGFIPKEVTRPGIQGMPGSTGQPTGMVVPKFSRAMRQNPVSPLKFQAPAKVMPSKGTRRVTIAPYRTVYARSLSNVAE